MNNQKFFDYSPLSLQIFGFLKDASIFTTWVAASLMSKVAKQRNEPILTPFIEGKPVKAITEDYLNTYGVPFLAEVFQSSTDENDIIQKLNNVADAVKVEVCSSTLKVVYNANLEEPSFAFVIRDTISPLEKQFGNIPSELSIVHVRKQKSELSNALEKFLNGILAVPRLTPTLNFWTLPFLLKTDTKAELKSAMIRKGNAYIKNFTKYLTESWKQVKTKNGEQTLLDVFFLKVDKIEKQRDAELVFTKNATKPAFNIWKEVSVETKPQSPTLKRKTEEPANTDSPKVGRKKISSKEILYRCSTVPKEEAAAGFRAPFDNSKPTTQAYKKLNVEAPKLGLAFSFKTETNESFGFIIVETWTNLDTQLIEQAIGAPARLEADNRYVILSDMEDDMVKKH
jgi:hypothetical protein